MTRHSIQVTEVREFARRAPVGNDPADHVFAPAQSLDPYDVYKAKIAECDQRLDAGLAALSYNAISLGMAL